MRTRFGCVVLSAVMAVGCTTIGGPSLHAVATVEPKSGSTVAGEVRFVERSGVVRAHVALSGLEPNSEHGFHIHDKGDCSAADATSAGGHFNPTSAAHGEAGHGAHHLGDLPSLVADANGKVIADFVVTDATLRDGPTSVMGRSVVVHRDRDDFVTQPSGKSGARIGCGVIAAK